MSRKSGTAFVRSVEYDAGPVPVPQAGWPGLRFTERLESFERQQHLPADDFAHVNFG